MSPILKSLHWLPVKQRIIFKILLLIYKFLTTGKPKFFAPYLSLYTRQDVVIQKRCSLKSPSIVPQFINLKFISTSPSHMMLQNSETRRSNPEKMFLKVPFYSSSVHKSKVHFNKSFSYDAPKLWNDLLLEIRTAPTLLCFKTRLKTCFRSLFLLSFSCYHMIPR